MGGHVAERRGKSKPSETLCAADVDHFRRKERHRVWENGQPHRGRSWPGEDVWFGYAHSSHVARRIPGGRIDLAPSPAIRCSSGARSQSSFARATRRLRSHAFTNDGCTRLRDCHRPRRRRARGMGTAQKRRSRLARDRRQRRGSRAPRRAVQHRRSWGQRHAGIATASLARGHTPGIGRIEHARRSRPLARCLSGE
jgi:hypothetical protein